MRQSSFPLRLAASLQEEARKTAESEGISLNQLLNLAIAEKSPLCVRKSSFVNVECEQTFAKLANFSSEWARNRRGKAMKFLNNPR
jgi:hypothetical protein